MNTIKTNANKMIALTGGQAHCPAPAMTATEVAINTQDLLKHASQLHAQLAVSQAPDSGIAFPYQGLTFFFKVRGGKLAVIDELGYLVIEGNWTMSQHEQFMNEFQNIAIYRKQLNWIFYPTPDIFPLFCQMIADIKKWYEVIPRLTRCNSKYLPFNAFGIEWNIRYNTDTPMRDGVEFIDICRIGNRTRIYTIAVRCKEPTPWETQA